MRCGSLYVHKEMRWRSWPDLCSAGARGGCDPAVRAFPASLARSLALWEKGRRSRAPPRSNSFESCSRPASLAVAHHRRGEGGEKGVETLPRLPSRRPENLTPPHAAGPPVSPGNEGRVAEFHLTQSGASETSRRRRRTGQVAMGEFWGGRAGWRGRGGARPPPRSFSAPPPQKAAVCPRNPRLALDSTSERLRA